MRSEAEVRVGHRALCGREHEPCTRGFVPDFEVAPADMAPNIDQIDVIHSCAAEILVRNREAGWFNEMRGDPQTGAEAEHGSGILGYIGLVQGKLHKG